ncbi:MAG: DinB family protein [Chloroflexi bacterium]|nr:DinB family protein [Chloroflexota bacterium]PWB46508.1 MAG: hypothetical protein C3F10_04705 [Dehalococcoidia bacterium]
MSVGDTIRKNLEFWHWYPRMLCDGLTDDQLHWQPEGHPNHIMYTLWHAYRSEDDLIHSLLIGRPGVFARDEWAARLPVEATGRSPFGNGLDRQGIAAVRLSLDAVLDYAEAVRASIQEYADGLTPEEGAETVKLPFFEAVYPMLGEATRAEVLTFFCVGHTAEHLGEVQYIKGLMGLQGAPL